MGQIDSNRRIEYAGSVHDEREIEAVVGVLRGGPTALRIGKNVRAMEQRVAEIEVEVARLEAGIAEAEQELAVFVNAAETQRLSDLLAGRRASLAALVQEWEETTAAMESA